MNIVWQSIIICCMMTGALSASEHNKKAKKVTFSLHPNSPTLHSNSPKGSLEKINLKWLESKMFALNIEEQTSESDSLDSDESGSDSDNFEDYVNIFTGEDLPYAVMNFDLEDIAAYEAFIEAAAGTEPLSNNGEVINNAEESFFPKKSFFQKNKLCTINAIT